jgi:hypothetical protein
MADLDTHQNLARQLCTEMRRAQDDGHWPVVVDAGFYAVFHGMEALNALECRDSYSFADAVDILERMLAPHYLGEAFVKDYEYLFYFRRGALYGAHFPSPEQLARYVAVAERAYAHVTTVLEGQLTNAAKGGARHA